MTDTDDLNKTPEAKQDEWAITVDLSPKSSSTEPRPAKEAQDWQISVDLSDMQQPTSPTSPPPPEGEKDWQISVNLSDMQRPTGDAAALLERVRTHLAHGEWEDMESCCRTILRDSPLHKEGQKQLAISLYYQKRFAESAEALKALGDRIDDDADSLYWLLVACREGNDTGGMYEAALRARRLPAEPEAEIAIFEAILDARAWQDAADLQEHALSLVHHGKVRPEQLPYVMVMLNHLPEISATTIYDIYRIWGNAAMQTAQGISLAKDSPPPAPAARMKIAYLSADFRQHPIGKFMRTIFASHDHHDYEIYCYAHMLDDDAITEEIRLSTDHFIDVTELDNEALARRIHGDGIHILVEIGSHMAHSRLAALAWKPAPVQITYLAEPNTTGLPTVDFRITDRHSEAPGGTRYSEKLLYMPESFLCMGEMPNVERATVTPAEKNGYITFGSFNGIRKFNPEVIAVWCKILQRVEGSKMIIKSPGTGVPVIRRNILKEFNRHGIGEERLQFADYGTMQEHAEWHRKVDIALDSFPYNGTTTTFDTLWMGVPVITLVGTLHAQRTSYSILKNIGFDTAAAAFSTDEYIDKAVALATNPETLSFLRRCLPAMIRHSILFQPERFTAQLESIYMYAWEKRMGAWERPDSVPLTQTFRIEDRTSTTTAAPARIFIAGMPKAAMPWVMRIISTLIHSKTNHTDSPPKVNILYAPTGEAAKALQEPGSRLIYIRRDIRDAFVALMDIHGHSMEALLKQGTLDTLIDDDEAWSRVPHSLMLNHETIVHTPQAAIQSIADYLGYGIDNQEAREIATFCERRRETVDVSQYQEDAKAFGLPDEGLLQADRETAQSGTDVDPAGIYRTHLAGIQAMHLQQAASQWLLNHHYAQTSYPYADTATQAMVVKIRGDISICLRPSIETRSSYRLIEREDCPEPEIAFLRRWLRPGMQCLDIGAGYGSYTIPLAKQVGASGKIWSFEPASPTANLLQHSLDLNHLDHCTLFRIALSDTKGTPTLAPRVDAKTNMLIDDELLGDPTQTTSSGKLDDFYEKQLWHDIDFVRLDISGHESRALEGGKDFLTRNDPLLMVAYDAGKQENAAMIDRLQMLDYAPYRLVPMLNTLVPFEMADIQALPSANLFFCKKERADTLHKQGLLADAASLANAEERITLPKDELWSEPLSTYPYAEPLLPKWRRNGNNHEPGWELYREALNIYVLAHRSETAPERLTYLQWAFIRLSELLDIHVNIPRLLTLARVALELGIHDGAKQILNEIIGHFDHKTDFTPEEPFIAVSKWAEMTDPQDRLADWAMAQSIQALLCLDSSYDTGIDTLAALQLFREIGFEHAEMERRLQLVRMRAELQKCPEPLPVLAKASEENLNPGFWRGVPEIIPSPT
ncbi:MAG TPA: FkbM family methyltransferase [Mariprofundaceae bacterium]|nr:FkbM family methyltransferase [Mariprofundaceae bacterium]